MDVKPLHYADGALGGRAISRKLLRKVFLASVLGIVFGGSVAACLISVKSPWIWFGSRSAYQWYRWRTFTLPPDAVVYEEEPSRASHLTSLPSEERGMFVGEAEEGPDRWPQDTAHDYAKVKSGASYWPAAFQVMAKQRSQSLLFMHERSAVKGRSRLVVVKGRCAYPAYSHVNPSDDERTAFSISCRSHQIGQPFRMFGESNGQSALNLAIIALAPHQVMRIYAGQLDPNDDAHFTIKYEINNVPGTIDGRLEADDTVTLKILDGPAMTKPSRNPTSGP